MCYGTGKCRHCHGMGFELTSTEKVKGVLLWLWVMSWFGFIGAFLTVGVWEYRIAASQGSHVSRYCLTLLIVTLLLWVFFFAIDNKARRKRIGAPSLFSVLAGTILAIHTLTGIFFFVYIPC